MTQMLTLVLLAASSVGVHAGSHTAGKCVPKSQAEVMAPMLKEAKCPDAKPTDCKCSGNKGTVYDCPAPDKTLWASTGKKCVKALADVDSTWAKHDWDYPADYWNFCPNPSDAALKAKWIASGIASDITWWIEPGSYDCTKVEGKTHEWKTPSDGYNKYYNSSSWCSKAGCYVDPCTCNQADMAVSSWFKRADGGAIYYSYGQCGAKNEFTTSQCSSQNTTKGCEGESACKWDNSTGTGTATQTSSAKPVCMAGVALLVALLSQ